MEDIQFFLRLRLNRFLRRDIPSVPSIARAVYCNVLANPKKHVHKIPFHTTDIFGSDIWAKEII